MRCFFAAAALAAALAVGCGAMVVEPGASGATASGSGGATTTTTTTTTSGMGGSIDLTTGSGGGPACNDGSVFVSISGDVPFQLDASCLPEGHLVMGSPGPPSPPPPPPKSPPEPPYGSMVITGCTATSSYVIRINADTMLWPGMSAKASVSFVYNGVTYAESPAQGATLDVTLMEPTGGVIEGSFSATLTAVMPSNGPATLNITGKFRVCHGFDLHLV